ncbi:Dcp2, box A domain-containing protein [Filobasidium floriforme]|uniref:Dcp2, box A domain-containing protein n=1 Tax=Filobasidium floriforme TaxID=5210 RepID=UPI001E8E6C79|nr:Dcp2, box A domain-containing protein [Filobasidium floriforme]KAH8087546.1 Dcp2, box A domain-containing protein [Filobasidium floriforme]
MKEAGLEEVLEDLSSRFILNLPEEELASPERICFQVEQAHWFYEDFIRTDRPNLPSFNLKSFSSLFFLSCPLLSHWLNPGSSDDGDGDNGYNYERLWERFMKYKNRVPVCGGILLDSACEMCVLVKGWKSGASWGFPKGKINDEEERWGCAVREVHEEIGYDITPLLNLDDFIEVTMNDQKMTLFIVCDVPRDAKFETLTRKEISAIEWVKLSDLPTWRRQKRKVPGKKFYSVAPFVA